MLEDLRGVLEAYTMFRPDIGYVQGMSFLGAMLLLNVEATDAFMLLCNMLNSPMLQAFYRVNMPEMEKYFGAFSQALQRVSPRAYANMRDVHVSPHLYLVDWVMTLFSRSLPLELAARVWDMFLLDGESAVLKVALGVIRFLEEDLSVGLQEDCLTILTHLERVDMPEDELFSAISQIDFSPDALQSLLR
jgi:Rab-GTPase-TBC domain